MAAKLDDLFRDIVRLFGPDGTLPILRALGKRVGVFAEGLVIYPDAPNGRPLVLFYDRVRKDGTPYKSKFKSLKQQRKVFKMIAEGQIPYSRSGILGGSITSDVQDIDRYAVAVSVGTAIPYAPYVIGAASTQNHYHTQTGWVPLPEAIQLARPKFEDVIERAIPGIVNDQLSKGLSFND